jgi:hypothetical protein
MNRLAFLAAVACLWAGGLAGTGRADMVVFSTFGPGDSFSTAAGAISESGFAGGYLARANAFQPSSSVALDSIRLAVFDQSRLVVDLVLAEDAGGTPGGALETFS